MSAVWTSHHGRDLAQGDLLPECLIPLIPADFGECVQHEKVPVPTATANVIVVTQSCDLAHGKSRYVALCRIYPLEVFESISPDFRKKKAWEPVRQGRREGLHMLPSPEHPDNNREARVVDFRQIHSLPFEYLARRAERLDDRWRLQPPYREHFSQSFARYFMRVGIPSPIPEFQ